MTASNRNSYFYRFLKTIWPWFSLVIPIVIMALLISSISPAASRLVTDTLIKLIMVLGLYIFIGNSGIMSFGHGSFMIIGAYASAWLTISGPMKKVILPDLPVFIQTLSFDPGVAAIISICVCVIFAFIVGIPLMRLSGIAAAIATFALFMVVSIVYNNWMSWTKGTASLIGLPVYPTVYNVLIITVLVLLVADLFRKSKYGLFLRATREDAVASRGTGLNVENLRLIAFVLSAAICALGGILWGHNN